jgi:transcriptional regulator with XRE-family HTH domain
MDHRHDAFAVKLGKRIEMCRRGNNHTRKQAAALIKVDLKTIERWEKAQTEPGIFKLRQLARHYGIPLTKLLED